MEDASIFTAEILLSFSANPELTRSKDSIAIDALVIARFQQASRPAKGTPD